MWTFRPNSCKSRKTPCWFSKSPILVIPSIIDLLVWAERLRNIAGITVIDSVHTSSSLHYRQLKRSTRRIEIAILPAINPEKNNNAWQNPHGRRVHQRLQRLKIQYRIYSWCENAFQTHWDNSVHRIHIMSPTGCEERLYQRGSVKTSPYKFFEI